MSFVNLAGYKFIVLNQLAELRTWLLEQMTALLCKGTILLSQEGININVTGTSDAMALFKAFLATDSRFADMDFRESVSQQPPFALLKVKIKQEIITLGLPEVQPVESRAPSIAPQRLKQWLDDGHDITSLDTRNAYEVRFGTFAQARHCAISDFGQFPAQALALDLPQDKPIVMFCTGGIRCEKAALHLLQAGYPKVMQLEGGILNYFAQVGGAHYDGACFVFDQRVAVDANLAETGAAQCLTCQGPVTPAERQLPAFMQQASCQQCALTISNESNLP